MALLVVPLQMSLVPLLTLYNGVAHIFGAENGKTYFGVWLAHTAFGLPFAIYLLRNSFFGLPRDLFDAARVDGATHFQVFTLIVAAAQRAGDRIACDLPVPLGVERSSGRDGVPGNVGRPIVLTGKLVSCSARAAPIGRSSPPARSSRSSCR